MHDHATCEQLMAAAQRAGKYGRLEYLSWRCDRDHGDLTTRHAEQTEPDVRDQSSESEEASCES